MTSYRTLFIIALTVFGLYLSTTAHAALETWEVQYPPAIRGMWASSGTDVFAVGDYGSILHYDGTNWSSMTSGTTNTLYGVWGSSASNVYAVGAGGKILQYNGEAWSSVASTGLSGVTATLRSIWGVSGSNIFVVGNGGTILRYTDSSWAVMPSVPQSNLTGVWGSSATNVYAVGLDGKILRYDGSSWAVVKDTDEDKPLTGIWGSSASDIYAVGYEGTILHCDDGGCENSANWDEEDSDTPKPLYGIWGSSDSNVYAVGLDGTLRKRVDSDTPPWSVDPNPTTRSLNSICGLSGTTTVYAGGDGGTILSHSGTWGAVTTNIFKDLQGVWGSSGSNVFAVGNSGTILHLNNSNWTEMVSGIGHQLNDVWGSSTSTDVYAVSSLGQIYQYQGSSWGYNATPGSGLNSIWGTSSSNIFTVGAGGEIHRYLTSWSDSESNTPNNLNCVRGSDASNVFAVGDTGTIRYFNGSSWSVMTGSSAVTLNGVWTSSNRAYAVGEDGTILRFNYEGVAWTDVSNNEYNADLNDIWGSSNNDIYTVGISGEILHSANGTTFLPLTSGTTSNLNSIWGSSATNVFIVGNEGTILHSPPALTLTLPSTVSEGDGTLTSQGMVSVGYIPAEPLTITLSSDSVDEITVSPSSVEINGSNYAIFDLMVSDHLTNGSKAATITASVASQGMTASTPITVQDNVSDLTLSIPETASENAGVLTAQGSITVNYTPSSNLTFTLTSSDTSELTVPETVTILANHTSATFDITPVDDAEVDGTKQVTVTASKTDWSPAEATMNVTDNDIVAVIDSPVADLYIYTGTSVDFKASVSGGKAPLTYDWRYNTDYTLTAVEDPGYVTFYTPGPYQFVFTVTDADGNSSSDTVRVVVTNYEVISDDAKGGCFIQTLNEKKGSLFPALFFTGFAALAAILSRLKHKSSIFFLLTLLLALTYHGNSFAVGKNTIGVKLSYLSPSEETFKDNYEDDSEPAAIYYDRMIAWHISADIELGYQKKEGDFTDETSTTDPLITELKLYQLSSSLKWNVLILPLISGFVGAGLDYWKYKESGEFDGHSIEKKDKVGGYHGKAGLELLTKDKDFSGFGVILEAVYSVIDRFGNNDTDLGGWSYDIGMFYKF